MLNQKSIIFTEAFNCAKILNIALGSFHSHHDLKVHIFGTQKDFDELNPTVKSHPNNIFVTVDDSEISEKFRACHEGTAIIFAKAFSGQLGDCKQVIHFDSDVYFKRESISLIESAFDEGYDIVGARRCYGNNPGGVPGLHGIPDSLSTYFIGIKIDKIPNFDFHTLTRMWVGGYHPLGHTILDFGDPIIHCTLNNGGRIKFLDWNHVGSQDDNGKKTNNYKTNLHMDMGSHLCHFGGVGSGYAYKQGRSTPGREYAEWALGRWSLFAKLFYGEDIGYTHPTQYKADDGRWVFGNYDENILENIIKELYES